MLQAHSLLWNYLWVAPNILLLILALLISKRGVRQHHPVFFLFTIIIATEQVTIYAADILPSVGASTWWQLFWAGLLVEALFKFALVGELFDHLFGRYPSVGKLGKWLISGAGIFLVLLAAVVAAYTPKNNTNWIVSGAHILEQTIYLIESGLIFFLFVLAAYFKLRWGRKSFGIALGLGISASVHLGTWALLANGNFSEQYRIFLVFANMATYHVCVLIWYYYLLLPQKSFITSAVSLPEHNLELWNRELERLLQP